MRKVTLRRIAKSATPPGDVYGKAELDPSFLPDEQRRSVLKELRMGKAVEWLVAQQRPTVEGLAELLGVSRATIYRMLANVKFQALLRQQVLGRMAVVVQRAHAEVVKTMEEGSPMLRFRAATWLMERWDRICEAAGHATDEATGQEAVAEAQARSVIMKVAILSELSSLCRRIPALAQYQEQLLSAVKGAVHVDVQKEGGDAWLDGELEEEQESAG